MGAVVIKSSLERLVRSKATAVVYFGSSIIASALFSQAANVTGTGNLQWLFSGSIGGDQYFAASSTYVRGYLSIAPGSRDTSEFKNYWLSLDEKNNPDNPWHSDWYMTVNNCKLPGVNYAPYKDYQSSCPQLTAAQKSAQYVQNQYVTSTIDAIYAFASALKKARSDNGCGTSPNCSAVASMTTNAFFTNYLKKVNITYGTAEGIPSLATAAAPTHTAHKVSFDSAGELVDSFLEVWNYNNVGGKWLPKKVRIDTLGNPQKTEKH
jgi:hypothetical protein